MDPDLLPLIDPRSVGADKRIIGFELQTGRAEYKHPIESKYKSVLPNPGDFNFIMVQPGNAHFTVSFFNSILTPF
ncbi:transducin family protein / WD-40 repeat family protein [Artemisia annua]|uniref:Transducin family protein / WD-40 repeat family protein n=1 Tax=Artemisia annua TaxID=35608 RepID=A0A2U1MS13_ARTAN|nr:transducin family protein / WD-40 repeat family protein [Artemisia annua]